MALLSSFVMWHPDTLPMTNAIATMERPNAMAMPSVPSVAPATAALPQPNSVSTNVPNASAAYYINPAVSFGLFLDKRLSGKDLVGYWVAQFVGGIVAAAVLALVISMCDLGGVAATGLGCDGYGAASAVGISLVGALIVEVILTCIFVLSVLGSTADERTAPYAGIIIGLTLAFVHIMGIPLTGTSVNPARSFGPALMMAVSGDASALSQVWVFIAAPLAGAALAALIWMGLKKRK